MEITTSQLKKLEGALDKLFANIGIDIVFTRHFMDRVNDSRGGKPIKFDELRDIFVKTYRKYSKLLPNMSDGVEAVLNDLQSQLNIPFVMKWDRRDKELDLVSKTVMRKRDFKTNDPKLQVESPFLFQAVMAKLNSKIHKKTWKAAIDFFELEKNKSKTKDLALAKTARTFGIDPHLFRDFLVNSKLLKENVVFISESIYNDNHKLIDNVLSEYGAEIIMIESKKVTPKKANLSFSDQIDQNRKVKEGNSISIDNDLYNWVVKKFGKGNNITITNIAVALAKQKIDVHSRTKSLSITTFGDYIRVLNTDSAINDTDKSQFFKVR